MGSAAWAYEYLVSLGELAKPYMVHTIRVGRSVSDKWETQWTTFTDSKGTGTRDPRGHDAGTLMEFFDTIALPNFRSEPWMKPYVDGSNVNLNADTQLDR